MKFTDKLSKTCLQILIPNGIEPANRTFDPIMDSEVPVIFEDVNVSAIVVLCCELENVSFVPATHVLR